MNGADAVRLLHRWAPVGTAAVVAADAALLTTGAVTGGQAVRLFLAAEVPLLCVTAFALAVAVRAHHRRGHSLPSAVRRVAAQSPFAPAVRAELRSYRALWLWARRRCDLPPGAVPLHAGRGTVALPAAFAVATIVEVAVLDLLLPWLWLRIVVAALSLWSLLMLGGVVALGRTRPHYLLGGALVLRRSGRTVAALDIADIAAVVRRRRWSPTSPAVHGRRLVLPNQDGTCLDIDLRAPVTAVLPAWTARGRGGRQVDAVSLHLDDPALLAVAVRSAVPPADDGPTARAGRLTAVRATPADPGGSGGPRRGAPAVGT